MPDVSDLFDIFRFCCLNPTLSRTEAHLHRPEKAEHKTTRRRKSAAQMYASVAEAPRKVIRKSLKARSLSQSQTADVLWD